MVSVLMPEVSCRGVAMEEIFGKMSEKR